MGLSGLAFLTVVACVAGAVSLRGWGCVLRLGQPPPAGEVSSGRFLPAPVSEPVSSGCQVSNQNVSGSWPVVVDMSRARRS